MKSQPWVSSCRAVQDRRVAQANAQHVARLMNVRPSIDMRRPKALSYKRSNAKREHMEVRLSGEQHKHSLNLNACLATIHPSSMMTCLPLLVWRWDIQKKRQCVSSYALSFSVVFKCLSFQKKKKN